MTCFYHPKVQALGACKRCMIPVCEACQDERYCPECLKIVRYMRTGVSGTRPAGLVEQDNKRRGSLTRQLMINRLAGSVLAETTSRRPGTREARGNRDPKADRAVSKPASANNVAVFVTGLALIGAFALGAVTSHRAVQAAPAVIPVALAPVAGSQEHTLSSWSVGRQPARVDPHNLAPAPTSLAVAVPPGVSVQPARQQQPAARVEPSNQVRYVPVTRQSGWQVAPSSSQVPPQVRQVAMTVADASPPGNRKLPPQSAWIPVSDASPTRALAPASAGAAAPLPRVAVAYPVAGDTLSMTSYVKLDIRHPEQVSVLSVAVDGKVVAKADTVKGRTELPVDTTAIANGSHDLQVMAMTQSGRMISAAAVPISVFN